MKNKAKTKPPSFILSEGKPTAVILDIDEYRDILERLEDLEDLKELKLIREKPLKFKSLDDFLQETSGSV